MSIPLWALLGFAVWTLVLLLGTVGVYRWSRILTGRQRITEFSPTNPQGADWYRRAMRAHANCIENLPVFGAIVFAMHVSGAASATIDALAITLLIARLGQSLVHVAFTETTASVTARFLLFFTQVFCMFGLAIATARHAA